MNFIIIRIASPVTTHAMCAVEITVLYEHRVQRTAWVHSQKRFKPEKAAKAARFVYLVHSTFFFDGA